MGYLLYTDYPQALLRSTNCFITIEAFDPASDYDLTVTNNPISHTNRDPCSLFRPDLDLIDLAIRQMIVMPIPILSINRKEEDLGLLFAGN